MHDQPTSPDESDVIAELLAKVTPHVCCSCGGTGWVDDENWSPEDWQIRAGVEPTEGAGLIPCGSCSMGDWSAWRDERTEPTTVVDGLSIDDQARVVDLLIRQRDWKDSALAVMAEWDLVFDALGRPGPLGASKPANVLAAAERLHHVAHATWHLMDDSGELGADDMPDFVGDYVHLKLDHQRVSDALDALEAAGWDPHPETA